MLYTLLFGIQHPHGDMQWIFLNFKLSITFSRKIKFKKERDCTPKKKGHTFSVVSSSHLILLPKKKNVSMTFLCYYCCLEHPKVRPPKCHAIFFFEGHMNKWKYNTECFSSSSFLPPNISIQKRWLQGVRTISVGGLVHRLLHLVSTL
jgi:hypothetical protein